MNPGLMEWRELANHAVGRNDRANPGIRRADDRPSNFECARQSHVAVLKGLFPHPVPRIVCDVDENLRAFVSKASGKPIEQTFIADLCAQS